jgi:dTMP kinase
MTARVLPGFIMGPIGGVLADRWDRKRTMVGADVIRAVIIFSLPLFPNLWYLLIASAVLESLTLLWGPAKDASLPHFVPTSHLTHANSLVLVGVYAPMPIAAILFAGLASLGGFLGATFPVLEGLTRSPEALALWINSFSFLLSAVLISTLAIPQTRQRGDKLHLSQIKRDLVEGLRFVVQHKKVRPWIVGIAFVFTAAGGVFSLGVGFVNEVLNGGEAGFAFLIGFLGTGMIVGLLLVGLIARRVEKDVLFSGSILLLGLGLIALASMGSLETALPVASALGFFAGAAYSTGYALMHENTQDVLRGRTFSAAYTVIRIGTLVGLGLFPLIAGAIGDYILHIGELSIYLPGTRTTLWLAGLFAIAGGVYSMGAIRDRWSNRLKPKQHKGFFVVFEGGEGAGKTTQIEAFVSWLKARGDEVIATREPGGTALGDRIRSLLLDRGSAGMDERTEALLYAADRAQHVSEVIRPALEAGKIVVSDRYVDSSLAYQGLARGLGLEEVLRTSDWATNGLLPDVVFYLKLDPTTGLRRVEENEMDRIELEKDGFHERVEKAYLELAERFPKRFVIVDAGGTPSQVHARIRSIFEGRSDRVVDPLEPGTTLSPPGPVAR